MTPAARPVAALGRVTLFQLDTLRHLIRPPFYTREFGHALLHFGWLSLPVVGLTAFFTGGARALQSYSGGVRFNAGAVVPRIVAIGMVREPGPVLVTLSTYPMQHLTVSRVLAALIVVRLLLQGH